MIIKNISGVPIYEINEYGKKKTKYCLCIPIINEGDRISKELAVAKKYGIDKLVDIIICDGGSKDGSTSSDLLKKLGVNTLLIKRDTGKQGAQLRMGFHYALNRGYDGIITIDGNNKDSIEDVPLFIKKLDDGYDFVQGSRFIKGGKAINTPFIRKVSVKTLHAPIISLTAGERFTDTTNAYRAYSKKYLTNPNVKPFRDIFKTYELLAYLSVKASQLGLKTCEVPVRREYPKKGKTPTKISPLKGNYNLFKILLKNMNGDYDVNRETKKIPTAYLFSLQLSILFLYFLKFQNYSISSFSERIMGNGLLNNLDIMKKIYVYLLFIFLVAIFTYIFGNFFNLILKKVNKEYLEILKYSALLGIISTIFKFTNIISKISVSSLTISVMLLLAISIITFIVAIRKIIRGKDINSENLKWSFVSALPLAMFFSLVINKIFKCNNLIVFIFGYTFFSAFLAWLSSNKSTNVNVLRKAYIPLMLSPIIESIFLETYNILNQRGIFLNHKYWICILIYTLMSLLTYFLYNIYKNKEIIFSYKKYYYPILLIIISIISTQLPMISNIETDLFEQSNQGSAIYGLLKYQEIPIFENFDAHMLSSEIGGIIYGLFNNDYIGAIFVNYNSLINEMLLLVLLYYLLKEFLNEDKAILFCAFLPIYIDDGLMFFSTAILPILFILKIYNNNKFSNYLYLWLSVAAACLWRLDIGFSIAITSMVLLIYLTLHNDEKLKKFMNILISLVSTVLSFTFIYILICCFKNINPLSRINEFIHLASSNVNWAYYSLGDSKNYAYTLIYFFMPISIILSLIYLYTNKEKYNKKQVLILFCFGLFYLFNFQRGMVRHSYIEGLTYVSLSLSALYYAIYVYTLNRKPYIFVISYIAIIIIFRMTTSLAIPMVSNSIDQSLNKYLNFSIQEEEYNTKINRVVLSEKMHNEYDNLNIVLHKLLTEDETFIDLSNQTLLYSLLGYKKPMYVNQSPGLLSGELTQKYFIDEVKSFNTPIIIKSKTKKLSNSLDDILNDYRYYLLSEFTFENYTPIAIVDGYEIWVKNELSNKYIEKLVNENLKDVEIVNNIDYYKNDVKTFELEYIPYIWGKYDNSFKVNNNIVMNLNNNSSTIKLDTIDKKYGNYISLNINSSKDCNGTIKLIDNNRNEYKYNFKILSGNNKYAIRISTIYEWYTNDIKIIEFDLDNTSNLQSANILTGDLQK